MEQILALFQNHSFCVVALGSSLLGMMSGGLGCFAVLRKESLLGDAMAHCALPGVILAFLLTGEKNLGILLTGGGIFGLFGCFMILFLVQHSTVKFDSALAMVLSVFFGGAMVLLTISQKIPNANQSGLASFIYGQAAAMLKSDVKLISLGALLCLILLIISWKPLKLLCFDPDFAHTLGYSIQKTQIFLNVLLVFCILLGLQTVGAILMSAMLVSPAISARRWVNHLSTMVILASILGGISGFLGSMLSSLTPSMPTGATIVLVSSGFSLFSLCFGKNQGLFPSIYTRYRQRKELNKCPPPTKSKSLPF